MYPKEDVSIHKEFTFGIFVVTLRFIHITHRLPQCTALYVPKHLNKLRSDKKAIWALYFKKLLSIKT